MIINILSLCEYEIGFALKNLKREISKTRQKFGIQKKKKKKLDSHFFGFWKVLIFFD